MAYVYVKEADTYRVRRYNLGVFYASLVLILTLAQGGATVTRYSRQALQDIHAGKYDEAREILQRALKVAPRNPELWDYLGEVNMQLHNLRAATTAFRKSISIVPQDSRAYFNLGVLYMREGDTRAALDMYRRGLVISPTNAPANQNYAYLLMKEGNFREAVQPLRRLEALRINDVSVRVALIESLFRSGMTEAGRRNLSKFFNMPTVTPATEIKLANSLIENHLLPEAQEVLDRVVHNAPGVSEAHARLGALFLGQGNYEDAVRQLGQAVELSPNSADNSMLLVEALLKWKHYPTALAFLKAVKSRFGSLPDYQYRLAWAHYGLNQVSVAASILQNLTQHHPGLDLAHYSLGDCYVALFQLKKAERQYRIAISLNPKDGSYYKALGQVLRKEGRVNESIADLQKALDLDPSNNQSRLQLAISYERKGSLGKAQKLLEAAVRDEPDLLAAHRVLAQVYYREGDKVRGDRQSAVVTRLDSQKLHRRARLLDSSDNPNF